MRLRQRASFLLAWGSVLVLEPQLLSRKRLSKAIKYPRFGALPFACKVLARSDPERCPSDPENELAGVPGLIVLRLDSRKTGVKLKHRPCKFGYLAR